MSIIVSDVSYRYPNQQILFGQISLSIAAGAKVSIIGDNGTGKSTLLRLIAGELSPASGSVSCSSRPYYVPQQVGVTSQTVSETLGVADKLTALRNILGGSVEQIDYDRLADDWAVESRCRSALDHWGLTHIALDDPMDSLSGGEKTKAHLAGLLIHEPEIILLDEPTNHLDHAGRQKLYDYISRCNAAVVVVSHDVTLLDRLDATYELSDKGIRSYGGNYTFYRERKEIEEEALAQQIGSEKAALAQARKKAQEVRERQERRVSRGAKTTGIPRIVLKGRQDKGESTGAKLSEKHANIISDNQQRLSDLRQRQRKNCDLKIDFDDARLHEGKLLVSATGVNFGYARKDMLWQTPLDLEIRSGDRIHIVGDNGSGKTTLIGLLTGELAPSEGAIHRSDFSYVHMDQQYSRTQRDVTILELAQEYNVGGLLDHEIKLRLDRALFPREMWDKNCLTLSGGERMRLYLCCLMICNHIPDVFILDEPTNNLDISSLEILTSTIRDYRGTVIVITHDFHFAERVGITQTVEI